MCQGTKPKAYFHEDTMKFSLTSKFLVHSYRNTLIYLYGFENEGFRMLELIRPLFINPAATTAQGFHFQKRKYSFRLVIWK
jgi:hypothetical protein